MGAGGFRNSWSLEDLERSLPRFAKHGLPHNDEYLRLQLDGSAPMLIAALVWNGFLPMGCDDDLVGKLHHQRCVFDPRQVHIGRKLRRVAKRGFRFSVNTAWDSVVKHIQEHTWTTHKGDCWLSDRLAQAYCEVNKLGAELRHGVSFHSVELWDVDTGVLVAGEVGYTCGGMYSSCTGFALKTQWSGVGTLQLTALARWLAQSGFELWDLGMSAGYKLDLGARLVPRAKWIQRVVQLRLLRQGSPVLHSPADVDSSVEAMLGAVSSQHIQSILP